MGSTTLANEYRLCTCAAALRIVKDVSRGTFDCATAAWTKSRTGIQSWNIVLTIGMYPWPLPDDFEIECPRFKQPEQPEPNRQEHFCSPGSRNVSEVDDILPAEPFLKVA